MRMCYIWRAAYYIYLILVNEAVWPCSQAVFNVFPAPVTSHFSFWVPFHWFRVSHLRLSDAFCFARPFVRISFLTQTFVDPFLAPMIICTLIPFMPISHRILFHQFSSRISWDRLLSFCFPVFLVAYKRKQSECEFNHTRTLWLRYKCIFVG